MDGVVLTPLSQDLPESRDGVVLTPSPRTSQKVEMVSCYSRIGALSRCSGPAMLNVSTSQFHENTSVLETVAENRWVVFKF